MYKIGDKIKLLGKYSATCHQTKEGEAIFTIDQPLKLTISSDYLIDRLNTLGVSTVFPINIWNDLCPFESGYLFEPRTLSISKLVNATFKLKNEEISMDLLEVIQSLEPMKIGTLKIVISCSLSQEVVANSIINRLSLDVKNPIIYHPFMLDHKNLPINQKRKRYIKYMEEADVLIAISKSDECVEIGESVSWEVAIAEHFRVPVLYMLNKEV